MMAPAYNRGPAPKVEPNCILLLTVTNAVYPITVEVIHKIATRFGNVLRIVIFKKNQVQAMVEFDSIDAAHEAKKALNNCDIYAGCCTLCVEYSKAGRLNVQRNNIESGWDFTVEPSFDRPEPKRTTLLDAPPMQQALPQDFGRKRPYEDMEGPQMRGGRPDLGGRPEPRHHEEYPPSGRSSFVDPEQMRPPMREPIFGGDMLPPRSVLGNVLSHMAPTRGPPRGQEGPPRAQEGRFRDQFPPERYNEERYDERSDRGPRYNRGREDFGRYEEEPSYRRGGREPAYDSPMGGGIVLMVYGLDDRMNCDRVFNILCLYGNVMKVRFLKTIEGGAMVQMADNMAVERAISYLSNEILFGKKLQLRVSKQNVVQDVQNPYSLKDGTPSFKSFVQTKNNRFNNPDMAAKNRMTGVTEHLHFFNAPPNMTEEKLRSVFGDAGAPEPQSVVIFPSRSERSSTGLVTMANGEEALMSLGLVNHTPIQSPAPGKFPYIFKLCFASGKGNPPSKRSDRRTFKEDEEE